MEIKLRKLTKFFNISGERQTIVLKDTRVFRIYKIHLRVAHMCLLPLFY